MKHVIFVRCRFDDDLLFDKYFNVMKRICIPSMANQTCKNFEVHVIRNEKHSDILRNEFVKNGLNFKEKYTDSIAKSENFNIQTRHDCDDYMAPTYIQRIQEEYKKHIETKDEFLIHAQPTKFIYDTEEEFEIGQRYNDKRLSMFLSVCQKNYSKRIMQEPHPTYWKLIPNIIELEDGLVKLTVHSNNKLSKLLSIDKPVSNKLNLLAKKYKTDKKIPDGERCLNGLLGHGYVEDYERLFLGKDITSMLEIGISRGSSIRMWRDYFVKRCMITAVDIEEKLFKSSDLESNTVRIKLGSQNDISFLRSIMDTEYDVIIDDGSHLSSDHIVSFSTLFPGVKSGGMYIIEDLHTSQAKPTDKIFESIVIGDDFYKSFLSSNLVDSISKIEFYKNNKLCVIYKK